MVQLKDPWLREVERLIDLDATDAERAVGVTITTVMDTDAIALRFYARTGYNTLFERAQIGALSAVPAHLFLEDLRIRAMKAMAQVLTANAEAREVALALEASKERAL
jgi:hypothetical protein